jgi:hypothetical protein
LELSYLVKWVRSDTDLNPFERSRELSLEALDNFRAVGDRSGQVRALIASTALTDPQTRDSMLDEAERLAGELGDDNMVAGVIAGRARGIAMSDSKQAAHLHARALELYLRTGNLRGQANCHFSLSVCGGVSADKRDHALEGAKLNRELGDPAEASRCMSLALMYAEAVEPLANLEPLAMAGLKDALDAGSRSQEAHFYTSLAKIAAAKGQADDAARYNRWAQDIKESDGLSPIERWARDLEMTRMMATWAKEQGDSEAAQSFEEEVERMTKAKPSE